MRLIRKIILAALFFPLLVQAQLEVKNHFGLTGKKDNAVKVITQDQSGYLLFSTSEGVFSYDGKTCTTLLRRKFQGPLEITALFTDSRNHLWLGTKSGNIYCYDRKKLDSLCAAPNEQREKITSFCELNNSIYAGTYGTGILAITEKKVQNYTISQGLSDNVVYDLTGDGRQRIWASTDGGISQLNVKGSRLSFSNITSHNGLPDPIVRTVTYYDGKLVAGMQDSGFCFVDLSQKKIIRSAFSKNWALGAVIHITAELNGDLTIGTEREGLLLIRKNQISIYDYHIYLKTNKIYQIFTDREKQNWLATEKGLSHFTTSRYYLEQTGENADENKILALSVDTENTVWLGTPAGIGRMNKSNDGKSFLEKLSGIDKIIISYAAMAPNGDTWFGTYGNGVMVHSAGNEKMKVLNSKSGTLSNDNVSFIFFDHSNVYVSTLGGGIDALKISDSLQHNNIVKLHNYNSSNGLGSDYIYAAITGTDGVLYAASDGGGVQQLKGEKFIPLNGSNQIKSNTAFSLCRDQAGHIVATSNADGLLHYDGNMLKTFRLNEGLRDEQPAQIIATENILLCIHPKGIDRVNCCDNSVSYYDLPDTEFEPTLNAVVYKDGKIYSGTDNGLLTLRTNKEADDTIKPLAQIREFFLNYKPFPIDSIVEFKHNQNSMAFAFGGIWLKDPTRLSFRFRLKGFEDEWQLSEQGKTVNYNNLNPGTYTFEVQAINDEEVWSDVKQHAFAILTPIWKRWWFWLIVIGVVGLGLYFFVRMRLRALQRENALLERRVKERTHQIEKQTAIIEQKNVELEQLSLVASKTDNVVLIIDPLGNCEYINESFIKLNGFGLDTIKEKYGGNIYQLSNSVEIRELIEAAVRTKKSVNYETQNNKALSGAEIWESSTLTPIFDENGELRKLIIIDTDVTLRKKQEQIIVQKNKDITDSIAYARKIQHAILPPLTAMQVHVPELFVLYMTKDIVSGDFYWFGHYGDYSIVAAVDCTGHGVPGAFMSLIGYNQLNRIVNEEKIRDPSRILEELNKGVLGVLHKNDSTSRDGMDIAICRINHQNNTLEFAGAMRPLWIVKTNAEGQTELKEIKADKIPIGTKSSDRDEEIRFHTRFMQMKKDETYYIFTDGYADQFGGPKDKKYSTGKFKDFLQSHAHLLPAEQELALKNEHLAWKGDHEQVDDILVIGFRG